MNSASICVFSGDMREQMQNIDAGSVDCIVTDPPYGQTSLEWDRWVAWWPDLVLHALKPSGSMWVFGTQRMFMEHASDFSNWKMSQDIVWEKQNGSGLFNDRFRRVHESIAHFYPKKAKWRDIYKEPIFTNDATAKTVRKKARPAHWIGATGETIYRSEDGGPKLMRSVFFAKNMHNRAVHPTQKPIEVLEPLIKYSCPVGGIVLDPFAGSGSTAVAARMIGRGAVVIEAREDYLEVLKHRINNDAPLFNEAMT